MYNYRDFRKIISNAYWILDVGVGQKIVVIASFWKTSNYFVLLNDQQFI